MFQLFLRCGTFKCLSKVCPRNITYALLTERSPQGQGAIIEVFHKVHAVAYWSQIHGHFLNKEIACNFAQSTEFLVPFFVFFFCIWVIGNQNDKGPLNTVRNDKDCLLVRLRLDKNNSCSWLPGIARVKWFCACVWWWPYHEAAVCLVLDFMFKRNKYVQAGSDTTHGLKERILLVCVRF